MAALLRFLRKYKASESAVATIEAALVLPLVLVLGVGTIEFGWTMSQIQSVQTNLRDAVRYVTRTPLLTATNGTKSINPTAIATATAMLTSTYNRSGIESFSVPAPTLDPVTNTNGALYLGGPTVYSIIGTTEFTPKSAGLLAIVDITLPRIRLRYEARHVGG